ncbi:hypothetical protein [Persicobacter diffluens]|uniref:hypothetical protein n=1 Tax=Persicobacter diffluens TaxID=981 RepID=UPI0030C6A6A7
MKEIIENKLQGTDLDVTIFEPNTAIREVMKKERVKLTPARALMLHGLYDLVRNEGMVSEFSAEKVCYFLSRFGAGKYFKLDFQPYFYGPYSGKIKRILHALNGSYITGYSDMSKKPFEALSLVADALPEVNQYISSDPDLSKIAHKTTDYLAGFYSDFSLELLSSVDYLCNEHQTFDKEKIKGHLNEWSSRKSNMFANDRYIDIAIKKVSQAQELR